MMFQWDTGGPLTYQSKGQSILMGVVTENNCGKVQSNMQCFTDFILCTRVTFLQPPKTIEVYLLLSINFSNYMTCTAESPSTASG